MTISPTARLGKAICSLNMRWPSNFDNHELISRLLLWRNLCECGYKVVQNIGLYEPPNNPY